MLNLFKLPFKGKGQGDEKNGPFENLVFNIFRKYLRSDENITPDDVALKEKLLNQKLDMLPQDIKDTKEELYDVFSQFLREVDDGFDKSD